jgi:aminoglycoside/choline kinase family phosphotransferase
MGPRYYDLVSLVYDPYVTLSRETRAKILDCGLRTLFHKTKESDSIQESKMVDAVLLQRLLKIIGSYIFLDFEKKKGDYMQFIIPTIGFLCDRFKERSQEFPFLTGEILSCLENYFCGSKNE